MNRGENAISIIRNKLGSTGNIIDLKNSKLDPSKAAEGTIRADYGRDLMRK